jgi:amidase
VPLELDPTAPCRVAVLRSGPWTESDTSVSAEVDLAAQRLAGAGYETVEAVPPRFGQLMDLFKAALWEAEHGLLQQVRERGDASMQSVGEVMGDLAAEIDSRRYLELFGLRTTIIREWTAFLDDYPLLLMPVSWRRPFPVDFDQRGAGAVLEVIDALLPAFAVNLCGLPALAVPTSIRPDGPAGVQLVAGRFREDRCLTAAEVVIREGADRPVREIRVRLPADETTYPEGSHAAHN